MEVVTHLQAAPGTKLHRVAGTVIAWTSNVALSWLDQTFRHGSSHVTAQKLFPILTVALNEIQDFTILGR